MPMGPRVLLKNACYHIITRGNQRQQVFWDNQDRQVYLGNVKRYKKSCGFLLYGYRLMPNHVHIVGQPLQEENMSKFMQKVSRSYTAYFNTKYKKVGHLWQDRFKSKVVVKDDYLIDCIHYIELNPIRAGLAKTALEYSWSSYRERILGNVKNGKMLDKLYLEYYKTNR